MEKLNEYQGIVGRLHQCRDNIKERINTVKENHPEGLIKLVQNTTSDLLKGNKCASDDYSHLYRHKTRMELVRISAAVMGIEFSYAAETAFVSPTLLKIGVDHQHMTLVWALSPLVGFLLCPMLGSMSDRCKLNMGRRRPFIIFFSIGVFLGLLLVPNGEDLGYFFGDTLLQDAIMNFSKSNNTPNGNNSDLYNTSNSDIPIIPNAKSYHPWGIFFTVLGTVLLDFDADACQSPSRAYLLDVCIPEDHVKGLSTFTIMAGLGGFMGYSMGGINWDKTSIGRKLGGHVKVVFTIITFIFIGCVTFTVTSFKEIPLWSIITNKTTNAYPTEEDNLERLSVNYGALENIRTEDDFNDENIVTQKESTNEEAVNVSTTEDRMADTVFIKDNTSEGAELRLPQESIESLSHYLMSIVYMPQSLRIICLTNLFCWMAHVCYSLYFTDFVGEAVFNGNPKALEGTVTQIEYEKGVRFGCWGMAMYSLSCAFYSLIIDKLIKRFKAKPVYVGGLLFYCLGMTLMALTRSKASVILFSWTAGVMYSTLFTMPYLLVAHYHSLGVFEVDDKGDAVLGTDIRGLGTDVAIISSMVFLAQFLLSLCMGTIVQVSGSTTAVISTASLLSLCGALTATKVMYLNL